MKRYKAPCSNKKGTKLNALGRQELNEYKSVCEKVNWTPNSCNAEDDPAKL